MDSLTDLRTIWLSVGTNGLPEAGDLKLIAKEYRRDKVIKQAALILTAAVLAMIMIIIVFVYKSTMLTTRIGEVLMLAACSILIATNMSSLRKAYSLKNCSNKEFMEYLEHAQAERIRYYKRTQVIGMAFVSSGLLLYVFESVHHSLPLGILAYALLMIGLLICWFFIRPRAFQRHSGKLNETLLKIEELSKQF